MKLIYSMCDRRSGLKSQNLKLKNVGNIYSSFFICTDSTSFDGARGFVIYFEATLEPSKWLDSYFLVFDYRSFGKDYQAYSLCWAAL